MRMPDFSNVPAALSFAAAACAKASDCFRAHGLRRGPAQSRTAAIGTGRHLVIGGGDLIHALRGAAHDDLANDRLDVHHAILGGLRLFVGAEVDVADGDGIDRPQHAREPIEVVARDAEAICKGTDRGKGDLAGVGGAEADRKRPIGGQQLQRFQIDLGAIRKVRRIEVRRMVEALLVVMRPQTLDFTSPFSLPGEEVCKFPTSAVSSALMPSCTRFAAAITPSRNGLYLGLIK
jgi:hypothetical protein